MGCGGDWQTYVPPAATLPANTAAAVSYPAGPYGTTLGDVADNIIYDEGLMDPRSFCKRSQDLKLGEMNGLRSLSLDDMFRGDQLCSKKKKTFLWLIASAGW
jgi:hypothetical protein